MDWFRNIETGEEYWENRTEANEGEEHLGGWHIVMGENGWILRHQNRDVFSGSYLSDIGFALGFKLDVVGVGAIAGSIGGESAVNWLMDKLKN